MFSEWRGLEYVFEVLHVLNTNRTPMDYRKVFELIEKRGKIQATLTYAQKVLHKMVKANLIKSSGGYQLDRDLEQINISDVLEFCLMPDDDSPLQGVCSKMKEILSQHDITQFYNFSD